MKKKEVVKLKLNRETLRSLDHKNLQPVAGGLTANCSVITRCIQCETVWTCI